MIRLDPAFDKFAKLDCFLDKLLGFSLRSDVRRGVLQDVALSPAGIEVVGISVGCGSHGQLDGFKAGLVMSGTGGDAIAGAGYRHLAGLERGVVRRGESPVGGKSGKSRVRQIALDQRPDFIQLSF